MTPSPPSSSLAHRVEMCPHRPGPVVVIGGGPAGLMAAETLVAAGLEVHVFDAMPSVGRKFLLAGKGGLNLTHSEPRAAFEARFGARQQAVGRWLDAFGPEALCNWAQGLGVETFVGSSGRVFPTGMKAAPLLRAWLHRLREAGVQFHSRHRWVGWQGGDAPTVARFVGPQGPAHPVALAASGIVLALGGASWPRLGSDGQWVPWLAARGVDIAPLRPANCGFDVGWSPFFSERFAGAPVKSVALHCEAVEDASGTPLPAFPAFHQQGEFVITATGVEGSLIYAVSARVREHIALHGQATVSLDLVPGRDLTRLTQSLATGRGTRSLSNHLKAHAGIDGVKAALLRETATQAELNHVLTHAPADLARRLKAWPLTLRAARPVAEAISTAGGVRFEAMTDALMLKSMPGVFCAGEMLDWEAPTGGYLLNACLASGLAASQGVLTWLQRPMPSATT